MKTIRHSQNYIKEKYFLTCIIISFILAAETAVASDITTAQTTYNYTSNSEILRILSGGSLTPATNVNAVIADPGLTGLVLRVNTSNPATGITASGTGRAIWIDNSELSFIDLQSGIITSAADSTIALNNTPSTSTTIDVAAGTTISNTASSGSAYAINITRLANIDNRGTISVASNDVNTAAINWSNVTVQVNNYAGGTINGHIKSNNSTGGTLFIYGGQVNGNITGANMDVTVTGVQVPGLTYTLNGDIGTSAQNIDSVTIEHVGRLKNATSDINANTINIGSSPCNCDAILYAQAGNIKFNTMNVWGLLDMTDRAKDLQGGGDINIYSSIINGLGAADFGIYSHTTPGAIVAEANSNIKSTIASPTVAGRITAADLVTNSANTTLVMSVNYNDDTYNSGREYTILTSTAAQPGTSPIVALNDEGRLIVRSTGDSQQTNSQTNRVGVLTYHTKQVQNSPTNNNLVVYITKDDKELISNRISQQNVYEAVDAAGSGLTGELKVMQNYIMTSNTTTAAQRQDALQSLAVNDIGVHKTTFDNSLNSILAAEKRLEELRDNARFKNMNLQMAANYKIRDANGNEIAQNDELSNQFAAKNNRRRRGDYNNAQLLPPQSPQYIDKGVWVQALGGTSKQNDRRKFDGYNANSFGIAVGVDKKVANYAVVGVSASATASDIKSSDRDKQTDVNSYQLNFYAGQFCPKYFSDIVVGVAHNRYESDRHVPVIGETATAKYDGRTYAARGRAGLIRYINKDWDFLPEIDLTYAKNHLDSYTESGAGTVNLDVRPDDATFVEGAIGASVGYLAMTHKSTKYYPRLKLLYGYALKGYQQSANSNFTGQSFNIYTQSADKSRHSFRADLGVNAFTMKNIIISGNYLFEYRPTGFQSHTGLLRISYNW